MGEGPRTPLGSLQIVSVFIHFLEIYQNVYRELFQARGDAALLSQGYSTARDRQWARDQ